MPGKAPRFSMVVVDRALVTFGLPLDYIICPGCSPPRNYTKMLIDLGHLILIPKLTIQTVLCMHYGADIFSNVLPTLDGLPRKKTHTRIGKFGLRDIDLKQIGVRVVIETLEGILVLLGLLIHINYN